MIKKKITTHIYAHGLTKMGIPYVVKGRSDNTYFFILFHEYDSEEALVAAAKHEIIKKYKALKISEFKHPSKKDWDDMYIGRYFEISVMRDIIPYHIFMDRKVASQERIKGTTPEEFVDQIIIPLIPTIALLCRLNNNKPNGYKTVVNNTGLLSNLLDIDIYQQQSSTMIVSTAIHVKSFQLTINRASDIS